MIHFGGNVNKKITFLSKTFLFKNVTEETLGKIESTYELCLIDYNRGDIISSPSEYKKGVYFVYDGSCQISSAGEAKNVTLNTLTKYDSFGALTLFGEYNDYPTEIVALKKTTLLFISKDDVLSLVGIESLISYNLMNFLTERIYFLNEKIGILTKGSIESMLATYIINRYKKTGQTCIKLNMKSCSEMLGVGRASVYRALGSLSNKGALSVADKAVIINDIKILEDISK